MLPSSLTRPLIVSRYSAQGSTVISYTPGPVDGTARVGAVVVEFSLVLGPVSWTFAGSDDTTTTAPEPAVLSPGSAGMNRLTATFCGS